MFDKCGSQKPKNERNDFITEANKINEYPTVPKVAYCLAASTGRHTGTDWSRTYVVCNNGVRRLSPLESERLQGFPDNWTNPNEDNDTKDENIDTLRYTAIGNAVTIPVVEWIAKKVYQILETNDENFDLNSIIQNYSDFQSSASTKESLSDLDFSNPQNEYKWLKGGLVWNNEIIECNAFPTPEKIKDSSLLPLIDLSQNDKTYYLTPNAAEGILRRVDNQKRSLFTPLRLALEELKSQNR